NRVKSILSFKGFSDPLLDFIRANSLESAADVLSTEEDQNLPAGRTQHVDAAFNELALALFRLQFAEVAPYRKFCEARNAFPENVTNWALIPALPTSAFKELEITSLKQEQRTHVFHSSGTTEQIPSRHFHNADSLAVYEASLLPWFQKHFLADWDEENSVGETSALTLALSPMRGNSDHARGKLDDSTISPSLDKILPLLGGEG